MLFLFTVKIHAMKSKEYLNLFQRTKEIAISGTKFVEIFSRISNILPCVHVYAQKYRMPYGFLYKLRHSTIKIHILQYPVVVRNLSLLNILRLKLIDSVVAT